MLAYIKGDDKKHGLKPVKTENTISLNEARKIIIQLSQPLADISQLICDNILALERHKMSLNMTNLSLSELKSKLYIPVIDIRQQAFERPRTVCASTSCCETYKVSRLLLS